MKIIITLNLDLTALYLQKSRDPHEIPLRIEGDRGDGGDGDADGGQGLRLRGQHRRLEPQLRRHAHGHLQHHRQHTRIPRAPRQRRYHRGEGSALSHLQIAMASLQCVSHQLHICDISFPPQHELADWTLIFMIGAVVDIASNVLYLIFAKAEQQPFDKVDDCHDEGGEELEDHKQRKA